MRHLVLVLAASALALSGCGKKEATGNTAALDESVTAQDFATNDVTAIDAATGADANMAADVDINVFEAGNGEEEGSAGARPRPRTRPATGTAGSNAAEPADEPASSPASPPAESNSN